MPREDALNPESYTLNPTPHTPHPPPPTPHPTPHTPHPTPHTQLKYMRHVLSESYPEKMTRMVLATLINLTTDKGGRDVANQVRCRGVASVLLAWC